MSDTIKGMTLCRGFFFDAAKPILDALFPDLTYSAGLLGYGSDVLGYDNATSRDHMWGPRFYLFLREQDMAHRDAIMSAFAERLPCTYCGFSVNFTPPDPNDNGVRHPQPIDRGPVAPLIWVQTFDSFLTEQLGTADLDHIGPLDWLAFSEHRLLSLTAGRFFTDGLHLAERLAPLRYYPDDVRRYLIASNWDIIATEQAFVRRAGDCGDEIGSILLCARIAERLMRLCFLYRSTYAPYSKWFGTAFAQLDVDDRIKRALDAALHAGSLSAREDALVEAQALVAGLHNQSGLTSPVDYQIESYYGRQIKVIFADKFSAAAAETLAGTPYANLPLIGTLSQIGGLSELSDNKGYAAQIKRLYE